MILVWFSETICFKILLQKKGAAENLYNRVGKIEHLKFLLFFDAIKQHIKMLKNKKFGTELSRKAMKKVQGGVIPPGGGGGGCIPFLGSCRRTDTCCPYVDGSPVFCSATATKPVGTCSLVA
jgi:hypothetical protein